MAITGLRVSPVDGTTATLDDGTAFDASSINGTRVGSGVALPSGQGVTYHLTHAEVIDSIFVKVLSGTSESNAWKVYFSPYETGDTWLAPTVGPSTEESPYTWPTRTVAKRIRLDVSDVTDARVAALHVYRKQDADFTATTRTLQVIDEPRGKDSYQRKLGEFFDLGPSPKGGSHTGQFALFNRSSTPRTLLTIEAHAPGDTSAFPAHQHVLFSLDRITWSSRLTLPAIAANRPSPLIYFVANAPAGTAGGRTTVHVSVHSGDPAQGAAFMIYRDINTTSAIRPNIWFTDRSMVESGGAVTIYGRGLSDADWSAWSEQEGWSNYSWAPWVTTLEQNVPEGEPASAVVSATADPSINVEVEHATLNLPAVGGGTMRNFAIRVWRTAARNDIFHWVRLSPIMRGDLGLPPALLESGSSAVMSQRGLTPGGGIEQARTAFSTPQAIVSQGDVRGLPDVFVSSRTSAYLTGTSVYEGRIQPQGELKLYGLHRWFPSSSYLDTVPAISPTTMWWSDMTDTRRLQYDTQTGPYLDPSTEFDTSDESTQIIAPAMVFPNFSVARMTTHFGNMRLSDNRYFPSYTVLMVVLLGPDPSPTYQEVALGRNERLASTPARLFGTWSDTHSGPSADLRFTNRQIVGASGQARAKFNIDYGFLGRRPIIVGLTVSGWSYKGKIVPYTRVTYVGHERRDKKLSNGPFAPNAKIRIGHGLLNSDDFRVLEFIAGPRIGRVEEGRIINQLDSIYGVTS